MLRTIFVENWGALIARFRAVEDVRRARAGEARGHREDPAAHVAQRSRRSSPSWFARSRAASSSRIGSTRCARRSRSSSASIEEGQSAGAFRRDVDARLASWIFYGGLEEVLTGWVLGQLPDSEDDVARAERTAIEIALRGLAV